MAQYIQRLMRAAGGSRILGGALLAAISVAAVHAAPQTIDWDKPDANAHPPHAPLPANPLGMEDYSPNVPLDITVKQSRVIRIKHRVVRTSVSDAVIAEPVMASDNELVVQGKKPGDVTLQIWDSTGQTDKVRLHVSEKKNAAAQPERTEPNDEKPIPAAQTGTIELEETKPTRTIDLAVSQSKTFQMKGRIVRSSVSNPAVAELVAPAQNIINVYGRAPGSTTINIWDDAGNTLNALVRVSKAGATFAPSSSVRETHVLGRP